MQDKSPTPKLVEDDGKPSSAGAAVSSSVVSRAMTPQSSLTQSSAQSSPMKDEPKQSSDPPDHDTQIIRPDPMKDPALKFCSSLTADACRCRHLEQCMFPRYLSLDCKQMDDFSMGCIKDIPNRKNLGRVYIEALHLKEFMKSPEAIISEKNKPTKGKNGKRGRNNGSNSDSPSKKKNRSSPSKKNKDKNDELVTDNSRLSQTYLGGLEGKRTWFLANSHQAGKGGGISGSYCNVFPSSVSSPVRAKEASSMLKSTAKKSKKGASPSSNDPLDDLLSSEVKLTSLRKSMRLHDQSIPDDADPAVAGLENLTKPLPGYTPPPSIKPSNVGDTSFSKSEEGVKKSPEKTVPVTSSASSSMKAAPTTPLQDGGSQPMEIDSNGKGDIRRPSVGSNLSNNNVAESVSPMTTMSSNEAVRIEGPTSIVDSFEKDDRQFLSVFAPKSNYDRAMYEGREASLAANKLLEAFRLNRRNFWAHNKLKKNGKAPECVWCSSTSCSSARSEPEFSFGAIRDDTASSSKIDTYSSGGQSDGHMGDSLIQCLECDLVGCAPRFFNKEKGGIEHIMIHFLMSGHRYGVTCGPLGELFCMGCSDFVYHEVFDQERERVYLEQNIPTLSWKETPIIRSVDASSFVITPEHGVVWRGMMATYPSPVSAQFVQASQLAAKRLSIFNHDFCDRTIQLGPKASRLSCYQELHRNKEWFPVGMYNLGNTCYMSATLQCLIHCKPLQELFLQKLAHPYQSCRCLRREDKKTSCLICEMDKFFLEYYGNAIGINTIAALEEQPEVCIDVTPNQTKMQTKDKCGHPIIPSNLLGETWKTRAMKHVAGHSQHDAQEFFNAFIDCLATNDVAYQKSVHNMRQSLYESQIKPAHNEESPASTADFIKKMFMGTLRSVLVCQKCGCKRTQTESFSNISLPLAKEFPPIESQARSARRGKISVKICLKHFTRPETLSDSVFCPSCNSKTKTLKQHTFSTLPEILCLHLKRFDAAANKKILDFVAFPAYDLNMGPHLPQWCEKSLDVKEKNNADHTASSPKVLYDLFATVNHKGTLNQGHYVANVKCDNHWFSCNDAFVTNAGVGDGEKEVLSSEGAYMLFYKKKDRSENYKTNT